MKQRILNIIKNADEGVTYNEIVNNLEDCDEILIQTELDILRDGTKIIKFDKENRKFYHNPVSEVVEAPVTNDKNVIINNRVCYLREYNNNIFLNYYNPKAESYDKIPIKDKDDTLKWLRKFNNPLTTEEFQKVEDDNTLLWNNINLNDDDIKRYNERLKNDKFFDIMNKKTKTSALIDILKDEGFVKCSNNNLLYRFDKSSNSYKSYDMVEFNKFVDNELNYFTNEMPNEVVMRALNSLRNYKDIHHNILCFKNGYYNTDNWEFKEGIYTDGIPYYNFDFNYNPNAEQEQYFRYYWSNYEKELQTDLLELIGLLLVKGNPLKKLWFIIGNKDAGKSVFINILNGLLQKTSHLSLKNINKEGHELEALLNSNVNFMSDEADSKITNNSIIKKLTGNDIIAVNPKGKPIVTLKNNDVPKFVAVANNLPKFNSLEPAILKRLGIIIMNIIKPIPTEEQVRNLDELILNETNSLEWLIYNSLLAVENILNNNHYKPRWSVEYIKDSEFDEVFTKYCQPIRYFISKGFTFIGDYNDFDVHKTEGNDCFITNEDMNKFLNKASEIEQVQIVDRTYKNNVKPKVICGFINDEFSITNYKIQGKRIDGKKYKIYYDLQPTQYYYDIMKLINQNQSIL